jgi:hypothetical protein
LGVSKQAGAVSNAGAVTSLAAIAADASGNINMADNSSKAVYKLSHANNVLTKTQAAGSISGIAGVAADRVYQAPFSGSTYGPSIYPLAHSLPLTAIAVDGSGFIYVFDPALHPSRPHKHLLCWVSKMRLPPR